MKGRWRWLLGIALPLILVAAACGGGGSGRSASPTAPQAVGEEMAMPAGGEEMAEEDAGEEPADAEPEEEPPPAEDPEPAEEQEPVEEEEPESNGVPRNGATYRVTFDADWSAATHPTRFPSNPHFSGLIGATHRESTRFWDEGAIASDGIKAMSETGSKSPLDDEIARAIRGGAAENLLSGGGINPSPGRARLDFDVSPEHPYVTLVAMIAPSPDWFVGVSALSLVRNGDWERTVVVRLFAYDAGTDGGGNYTSANRPLNPRRPIERIESSPFRVDGRLVPLGTFTFRRID